MNYETNPIKRLIDWAWSDEDKSYISDDSIFLTSITLSWLLTSSNRQLRDYATKALISLLQNRVTVVLSVLEKFENINRENHINNVDERKVFLRMKNMLKSTYE